MCAPAAHFSFECCDLVSTSVLDALPELSRVVPVVSEVLLPVLILALLSASEAIQVLSEDPVS